MVPTNPLPIEAHPAPPRRPSLAVAFVAASVLAACAAPVEAPADESPPFDYALTHTGPLEVSARVGDAPAVGVDVIVRRPSGGDEPQPGILARGTTDAEGRVRLPITLRAADEEVEIVMNKAGLEGPYGNPSLRETFGPFAPSAWFRAPASSLEGLTVPFEEVK